MSGDDISVVIPARNAARTIGAVARCGDSRTPEGRRDRCRRWVDRCDRRDRPGVRSTSHTADAGGICRRREEPRLGASTTSASRVPRFRRDPNHRLGRGGSPRRRRVSRRHHWLRSMVRSHGPVGVGGPPGGRVAIPSRRPPTARAVRLKLLHDCPARGSAFALTRATARRMRSSASMPSTVASRSCSTRASSRFTTTIGRPLHLSESSTHGRPIRSRGLVRSSQRAGSSE